MSTQPDLEKDLFGRNLEHAKTGYANAQDTIKFIDTKTGIMTGVLVITTGLPFLLINFLASDEGKDLKEFLFVHPKSTWAIAVTLLLGLLFGTLSLMSSTNGLMARTPVKGSYRERGLFAEIIFFLLCKVRIRERKTPKFTLTSLFPLYPPERTADALEKFREVREGNYSNRAVLGEYATQLETIGNILYRKIERNRDAVRWFELQILAYALGALIGICLTVSALVIH